MASKTLNLLIFFVFTSSFIEGMAFLSQLDMRAYRRPTNRFTQPLVNATRFFASKILADLTESENKPMENNVFFSPYGISSLLAILRLASAGQTRNEIQNLLLFRDLPMNTTDSQFQKLKESIFDSGEGDEESLSMASEVFVDTSMEYKYDFAISMYLYHSTTVTHLDFQQSPQDCLEKINYWIANMTSWQIPEFLGAGDITMDTKMLLVNVLQFDGLWESPFSANKTKMGIFTLADGSAIQVPMMSQSGMFHHRLSSSDFSEPGPIPDIIEMPFKSNTMSRPGSCQNKLVILLPNQYITISQIQQGFDRNVDSWRKTTIYDAVRLSMPKFEMNYRMDLDDSLRKQGMTTAFDDELANFTSMTDTPVAISKSVHETTLTFSENGVSAAAASSATITMRHLPHPRMRVNRPFLFFIEECQTGAQLFFGRIDDPR